MAHVTFKKDHRDGQLHGIIYIVYYRYVNDSRLSRKRLVKVSRMAREWLGKVGEIAFGNRSQRDGKECLLYERPRLFTG